MVNYAGMKDCYKILSDLSKEKVELVRKNKRLARDVEYERLLNKNLLKKMQQVDVKNNFLIKREKILQYVEEYLLVRINAMKEKGINNDSICELSKLSKLLEEANTFEEKTEDTEDV